MASPSGSSGRLLLRAVYPGGEEQEVYLAPRLSIGRSADNVFVVPEAERHHAMVYLRDGEFWLEAYTDHARMQYQGEPVTRLPLRPGVRFRIGPVEFTCLSAEAASGPAQLAQRWQRCPGCGSLELPPPGEHPQPCPQCQKPLLVLAPPGEGYRVGLAAELEGLELRRLAGRGGMAWVIQAYDPQLDDLVALKVLFPHLAVQPEQARRFSRESQVLGEIRSPRVVRLWGQGEWEGLPWLKLQWVPGCTLKEVIEGHDYAREPFPFDRALRWMQQVAEGLGEIHGRGYVHRDVKPSNVLMDREGSALISDLGVGRRVGSETASLTVTGQLLGTWLYLAPECFHTPGRVDHRADQYSLGATFYHLLVGRAPQGRWALPGERNATVPEEFDAVMERLLASSPEDRYESLEELQEELRELEREMFPEPASPLREPAVSPSKRRSGTGEGSPAFSSGGFSEALGGFLDARLPKVQEQVGHGIARAVKWLTGGAGKWLAGVGAVGLLVLVLVAFWGSPPPPPPAERPPLLKAPFGAQQARRVQQDWAEHLGTPVVKTNSIGMKLVLIPPGEFQMGSPPNEEKRFSSEDPQHPVRITRPFYLGAYEVTQAEFKQVMGRNPSYFSPTGGGKDEVSRKNINRFPVEWVSWYDAVEFCNRLSQREGLKPYYRLEQIKRYEDGSIASAQVTVLGGPGYRLPTEAEWEYACRAGTTTPFHFGPWSNGTQSNVDGNYSYGTSEKGPNLGRTTRVGSYPPNAFGLYDMHGNVWEWCEDWYDAKFYSRSPQEDPVNNRIGKSRVLRGGSWGDAPLYSRCAYRYRAGPSARSGDAGFRVARTVEAKLPRVKPSPSANGETKVDSNARVKPPAPAERPPLLKAPFGAQEAQEAQKRWAQHLGSPVVLTNSIGMKLVLIPPGEFQMGSPPEEEKRHDDEGPQHRVRITRPFYLGAYEVTQAEFKQVMGRNPSWFSSTGRGKDKVSGQDTNRFPVEWVSWYDAVEFCNRLSQREGLKPYYRLEQIQRREDGSIKSAQVTVLGGPGYRLPTEAEWEYACRAGTTTPFHFGHWSNGTQSNVDGNYPYGTSEKGPYLGRTTRVGSYPPNAFGLYDMHGNVWEWCEDWYDAKFYSRSPQDDPVNNRTGKYRVLRGGSWIDYPWNTRSANRVRNSPEGRYGLLGFRVARAVEVKLPRVKPPPGLQKSQNNLRQLALAMHMFHDQLRHLPPAAAWSWNGRRLRHPVSWRVLLLPYMEKMELFRQYHFDEPWDSPNNLKVLKQMPEEYRHPLDAPDSTNTSYFVVVGRGTVFDPKAYPVTFGKITDGTSNTLMIVEAKRPVPWTKPEDIPFDPAKPPPKLGGWFPQGFNAAYCDAAVRLLPNDIPARTLGLLIQRNDGQGVSPP